MFIPMSWQKEKLVSEYFVNGCLTSSSAGRDCYESYHTSIKVVLAKPNLHI